jgi:hypothetical protein
MLNILESYDLQGFITGETKAPPRYRTSKASDTQDPNPTSKESDSQDLNPKFLQWRQTDHLAKGWLIATLSEDVLGIVVGLDTATEVWNSLVHAFARVSDDRHLELKKRLTTIQRGSDPLQDYLRQFKTMCDDLAAIGKPVPDHKKTFWLISGLGKGYEMFTTTMLRPPIPPYSEILVLLEAHIECFKLDHANTSTNQMAFVGQRANNHNYKGRKKNGPTNFNSKGKGFTQGQFFGSKCQNFSHTHVDKGVSPASSQGNNKEEQPTCQICQKCNHIALTYFNRFNHAFTLNDVPQALSTMTIADNQDSTWFLDTRATDHMIGDPCNLHSLTLYHCTDGVMVGNGESLPITHIGQANIGSSSSSLKLKDVILVPDVKKDLLFVSKLTSDYPFNLNLMGMAL